MSVTSLASRRARRLLVGFIAAFGLLWTSTAHADPVPITTGQGLDWGLKASWRSYIGPAGTTLSGGATRNADGTFHFPITGGSYDPTTRATTVRFGGTAQFLGHCEGAQPFERPCALDMTVTDPWIEINEDRAILHAAMKSRPREGGEVTDYPDVPIAALGVEDATPVVAAGTTTWAGLPAQVTLAASEVFTYTVGTVLDPVTFSYDGPGGKPVGEVFSEPGAATYTRQPISGGAGDRPRYTVPGKTGGPLVGIHLGLSAGLSLIDPATFELVPGSRYTGAYGAFGSVASDPATGTVFATQSNGPIRALTWDGAAWTAATVEGSVITGASSAGGATWDPQGKRYLVSRQVGADSQLWQVLQVAGVWTASKVGSVRQTNTLPAPLLQSMIAVPNGNPASTAVILTSWFGQVHRLTFAPDGVVAEPLANAPGVTAVKLVKTDNGAYAVADSRVTFIPVTGQPTYKTMGTALAPVAVPGAAGLSSLDTGWIAADAQRDALYVPSVGLTRVMRIETGKLRHAFAVPGMARIGYYADFLPGVTSAGDLVLASDTESAEFALAYQSTAPSFTTPPVNTTVDVADATATFTAVVAGDPAPTVKWQTRVPGQAGWADISGAESATLTRPVTADDSGRQYRALATNSAGTVASDRVTLTVRTPPTVAVQPDPSTVVAGASAAFKVMPGGSPDPDIIWQQLVGGFWRDVDAESGDFDVDGGFLTVLDTRVAMSGTQFRARLSNPLGTVFSRAVTLTVQGALTDPVTIRGGSVDWGVSNRWRCYVVGSVAHGGIELSGGVTRIPGALATGSLCPANAGSEALRFPVTGGQYDPATKRLSVRFGGSVRFWGHQPAGGAPVLDTRFSRLRLEADGDTGTLYADVTGATMADPTPRTWTDVALVTVDLAGAGPTVQDGRIVWAAAPSTLTAAGSEVFGAYPAGEPFDPITVSASAEPTAVPEDGDDASPAPAPQVLQTIQNITQVFTAPAPATHVAAPTIVARTATQKLGRGGVVTLATLRCPAGTACTVKAPARVTVTIAGKRYALTVLAPKTIRAGASATLRVRVPAAAAKRLAGRTSTVTVKVSVTGGATTDRTVKVKVKRNR